ncbi:hypothetical protein Ccrd_025810, partial [Cynara cardunculus var. scolymus]
MGNLVYIILLEQPKSKSIKVTHQIKQQAQEKIDSLVIANTEFRSCFCNNNPPAVRPSARKEEETIKAALGLVLWFVHQKEGAERRVVGIFFLEFLFILEKRKTLPVWHQKEEFLKALKDNQTLILVGETGSGKTTQIPQFVLEAVDVESADRRKKFMVGCNQPRRVAAMSVSRQVAEEMDVTIGEEVGYIIHFEDCSSARTVLKDLSDLGVIDFDFPQFFIRF